MQKLLFFLSAIGLWAMASAEPSLEIRQVRSFDTGWRFLQADTNAAQEPNFDDGTWQTIDVPHDWSIAGPFSPDAPAGGDGGFLPTGISWYRKTFTLPATWTDKLVFIEFDGIMANSTVWINGRQIGQRPSGYVSQRYNLTPHLKATGRENVIAVRTDTTVQPDSRWYTGQGIYRHVRLIATEPIRLGQWSTFVTTPNISEDQAAIRVQTDVVNSTGNATEVAVQTLIYRPDGKVVAQGTTPIKTIKPETTESFELELTVPEPIRWDIISPVLYTAHTKVILQDKTLDDVITPFGIREFRFEPATGFWLNGRNFKIKGACVHHDGGAFGAAVPLQVWQDRLKTLKLLGINAIRTAHNAVAPEFLDLCDRMGFLVMNEFFDTWKIGKRPGDYHRFFDEWALIDARETVRRDRNHPSVIIYSAGNEIRDTQRTEQAKRILASLLDVYHTEDPTRPVTQALFRPNSSGDYDNGLADILDVVGQNYRENELLAAYRQNPKRKIIGTENSHDLNVWLALRDNPPYAGQFIWSGIDYLGESRQWPAISTPFGLIDRAGGLRPRSYQRQSWWSDEPMVHIVRRIGRNEPSPIDPGYEASTDGRFRVLEFSDWTPMSLEPHTETVDVYSNCEWVELFLNGRSLGSKPKPADDSPRTWQVDFEAGLIKAVGSNNGKPVATHEHRTAGEPAAVRLLTPRSKLSRDWNDVVRVEVQIVDEKGVLVPNVRHKVTFSISEPGIIAAVDNADVFSHESFQANFRSVYQGRSWVWLKAGVEPGQCTLTAESENLKPATLTFEVK
ncbi:MAG: glycoside hydrolase family 2 protein [Planctomycetes bacterium]|nr:glycoside hydrolase family 2 protein [Planctomycetota bacterium]